MKRSIIESVVRCPVLSFLLTGLLVQATPQSYDLFQGSAYSGGGHMHRNKNWCARVVYKNVTCSVLGSAESYLEPELAPCPPHQPDCAQRMMYRTQFRPTYRIARKTVTHLEWRCCPGFLGPECKEPRGSTSVQTVQRPRPHPQPQPIPGQTQHRLWPGVREAAALDWGQGGDRVRRLEGEVQRLSRTVVDLQAAIAGVSENLRLDIQEDTSKMLLTLLNTLHLPGSDLAAGSTESVHLLGHAHPEQGHAQPEQGHAPSPDSPANSSREHTRYVQGHDPSSQGPAPSSDDHTPYSQGHAPSSDGYTPYSQGHNHSSDGHASASGGHAPSAEDPLHSHMEKRFQDLKAELLQRVDVKMAALHDSCDLGLRSLQSRCELQGAGYRNLAQQLDRKEAGLREEIRELRLQLGAADGTVRTLRGANDMADLRRELGRLADAHRALNARLDNEVEHLSTLGLEDALGPRLEELEAHLNVTERNAETLCFYVDDKLSRRIANETTALRTLLEERLGATEDQFTAMLVEIANGNDSAPAQLLEEVRREASSHGRQIQGLEEKLNALGRQCSAGCGAGPEEGRTGGFDDVLREVRLLGSELDVVRGDIHSDGEKLRDLESLVHRQLLIGQHNSRNLADQQAGLLALRGDVGALKGSLTSFEASLTKQAEEIRVLNSTCGREAPPCEGEAPSPSGSQVEELRERLEQLSQEVRAELARRRMDAAGGGTVGGDVPSSLQRVADTLNRHAASVWARVQQLHATQRAQAQGISGLASNLRQLQEQLGGTVRNVPGPAAVPPGQPLVHRVKQSTGPAAESRLPPVAPPVASRPAGSIIPHIHIQMIPNRNPLVSQQPIPAPQHPSNPLHPSQPQHPSNPLHPSQPQHPSNPLYPSNPLHPSQPQHPSNPLHPSNSLPSSQPLPPSQPLLPFAPRRPVMETGEAGPPGRATQVGIRVRHSSDAQSEPMQGYAGAPGYPPVSYRPNVIPAAFFPQKQANRPFVTPVSAGSGVVSEPFSFSAGLTTVPLPWHMGVICFDKVLVNDGGHYNPRTGIFTAPQEGRYLVTVVLTPQQGERVEAALSISERSVQRLATPGYGREPRPCTCGGPASASLILQLQHGDRLAVVRTAGRLAVSEPRDVLSTFSALFLYSAPLGR